MTDNPANLTLTKKNYKGRDRKVKTHLRNYNQKIIKEILITLQHIKVSIKHRKLIVSLQISLKSLTIRTLHNKSQVNRRTNKAVNRGKVLGLYKKGQFSQGRLTFPKIEYSLLTKKESSVYKVTIHR